MSSNCDVSQGGFALEQYTRAISQITKAIATKKQPTTDVVLVACILFACFEVQYKLILVDL